MFKTFQEFFQYIDAGNSFIYEQTTYNLRSGKLVSLDDSEELIHFDYRNCLKSQDFANFNELLAWIADGKYIRNRHTSATYVMQNGILCHHPSGLPYKHAAMNYEAFIKL